MTDLPTPRPTPFNLLVYTHTHTYVHRRRWMRRRCLSEFPRSRVWWYVLSLVASSFSLSPLPPFLARAHTHTHSLARSLSPPPPSLSLSLSRVLYYSMQQPSFAATRGSFFADYAVFLAGRHEEGRAVFSAVLHSQLARAPRRGVDGRGGVCGSMAAAARGAENSNTAAG